MSRYLLNWRVWIGFALSAVCLWLSVRDVPFSEFQDSVEQANYLWLIPGIVCILTSMLVRGLRWAVLLENDVSNSDTFWAFGLGTLFNNLLPLRAGDAVRVIALTDKTGIPAARIAATVAVERFLDIATILLLFVTILPFMDVPPFAVQAGVVFTLALLVGIAVLILMVSYQTWGYRMLAFVLKRFRFLPHDSILKRWDEVIAGIEPMTSIRSLVIVLLYSILSWINSVGFYFCVLLAFGSETPLVAAAFLVVVISLAISLPSSPGFIGVFHLAGQQALVQPFGTTYSDSAAFSIILVAYVTYYLVTSVSGGFGLLHFGKRFFALSERVSKDVTTEPQSVSL